MTSYPLSRPLPAHAGLLHARAHAEPEPRTCPVCGEDYSPGVFCACEQRQIEEEDR